MRNTTDKKQGAIACAAVGIGFFVVILAILLFSLVAETCADWIAWLVVLLYGAIILAVILGIAAALRQRLRELESGEEEDARKY